MVALNDLLFKLEVNSFAVSLPVLLKSNNRSGWLIRLYDAGFWRSMVISCDFSRGKIKTLMLTNVETDELWTSFGLQHSLNINEYGKTWYVIKQDIDMSVETLPMLKQIVEHIRNNLSELPAIETALELPRVSIFYPEEE